MKNIDLSRELVTVNEIMSNHKYMTDTLGVYPDDEYYEKVIMKLCVHTPLPCIAHNIQRLTPFIIWVSKNYEWGKKSGALRVFREALELYDSVKSVQESNGYDVEINIPGLRSNPDVVNRSLKYPDNEVYERFIKVVIDLGTIESSNYLYNAVYLGNLPGNIIMLPLLSTGEVGYSRRTEVCSKEDLYTIWEDFNISKTKTVKFDIIGEIMPGNGILSIDDIRGVIVSDNQE